ncbi:MULTISPECIES: sigma 54-interacting transcriptional regulator [Methylomonas]|uniref:Sigma-54-dependent Fis family transcriptional regulator n=1 Tax=Methylomonas koyamae TaxID=702114 RepID=A0A177NLZ0_9GAMM|nr:MULTISPECIES: sigma 54-interacting transcriptional regulator [Methylomonas]MDT4332875.1 sigma 54-interacting transcriptional regulator [Methylomonas sp. MV1]OAI18852.1 sigma-54-dependent Fis family transcriptional regulator [Methylomonas koyamae]WGS86038.1 sigma 54-interacting transcriptional regulator [Methylomonas sp. UP202]
MDIALRLPETAKIVQETFLYKRTLEFEVDRPVQAWRWMNQTRSVPDQSDWVRPEVAEAWRRCLEDYQLPLGNFANWQRSGQGVVGGDAQSRQIAESLADLGHQFHVFLKEAGVMLVLTAADGALLQALGENPFPSPFMRNLYEQNSRWSEAVLGNNGIGSAALLKRPVAFQGMEHFLSLLHPFSTVGYPLLDDSGELLAVIGLIADRQESMNSLFAFLHLLCVVLNTNLPLTRSPAAQARVLEKIPFKLAKRPPQTEEPAMSEQLAALVDKAVKLQQYKIPILITGESGVGKDHFVNLLKHAGPRREQPLIAINCASIPHDLIESELFGYEAGSFTGARSGGKPGKFLLADGGILFLDEIGDMSLDLQSTLLRVLETSEFTPVGGAKPIRVDVQIVAATNVPLLDAVEAGRFRRDLYYRLNGAQIHLPPLRERQDKQAIIHHILQRELAKMPNAQAIGICPSVIALIEQHPWPGNIRQLINVIRATLYTAGGNFITREDLPVDFVAELAKTARESEPELEASPRASQPGRAMTLEDWELYGIKTTLRACAGNISQAAKALGITRTTLYKKIDRFGLSRMASE